VVTPAAGTVVLVPFPFSDLSQAKLRPAVVLADVGRGDWILCQITSMVTQVGTLKAAPFQHISRPLWLSCRRVSDYNCRRP
jgi:mRNA interferase MazF